MIVRTRANKSCTDNLGPRKAWPGPGAGIVLEHSSIPQALPLYGGVMIQASWYSQLHSYIQKKSVTASDVQGLIKRELQQKAATKAAIARWVSSS
jgi:hypothetical protein